MGAIRSPVVTAQRDQQAGQHVADRQVAPQEDPDDGQPDDRRPLGAPPVPARVQAHGLASSATSSDTPCPRSPSGSTASTYGVRSARETAARSV